MNILADISALITALESIIKMAEVIDPNAANNPLVIKAQKIIDELSILKLV